MNSGSLAPRPRAGTPAVSNSSSAHPRPSPATARPPLNRSSVAIRFASSTGTWNGATMMLVPSRMRSVLAATYVSVSIGS